jgi:ribonucleoside-triphosphate reductase
MGYDIREKTGQDFTKEVLDFIEEYIEETSKITGHSLNSEEVPAESVAIKLCKKDKIVIGEENNPFMMYSNQFIPLVVPASIPERIKITGKFMDRMSGGAILHINLQEQIKDSNTMKKLIEYAVKNGVSHFAINYAFGTCENNHITVCGNAKTCPICGATITDWMTRIVGYFVHTTSWEPTRRNWEFPKRQFGEVEIGG